MEDDFPASGLIIGSQECRYDKIAEVINNAKGSPFRQNWIKFARKVDLPRDFIVQWELKVDNVGVEETIIKLLEKWSDRYGLVTLSQLTKVLQELELNSTAKAVEDYFNASISNKTPERQKQVSSSKGVITNRATKIVFPHKKAKPVHLTNHLFKPLLKDDKKNDGKQTLVNKSDDQIDVSLVDEHNKRCMTDWLKKRNYILGFVAVFILTVVFVFIGLTYNPFGTLLQTGTSKEDEIPVLENFTHYIHASTYQEFEKAVSQINPVSKLSVNITSLNSTTWPTNPKLSHSGFIKDLVVSNVTEFGLLFQILHQTINLERLWIIGSPGSNCSYNDSRSVVRKRVLYSNIISIQISNFSDCPHIYEFFSTFFVSHKLLTFSLVQSEINDHNIVDIQSIMQNSAKTLQNVTLIGQIFSTKYLFAFKKPLLQVKHIQLDIVERKVFLVSLYDHNIAGQHFCETLQNIQTFENTLGVNLLDFNYVLKCTQLQNLTAKVIIPSNGPFLNISSSFKGNYLEYVNLSLQFELPCPSQKNIKLLGIASLKNRIRQKSSIECINCPCSLESNIRSNSLYNLYTLDQRTESKN